MGNDGGSIPYRIDLVKTKAKEEKTDEKGLARALWLLCALSKVSEDYKGPVLAVEEFSDSNWFVGFTATSLTTGSGGSFGQALQQGCHHRVPLGPN